MTPNVWKPTPQFRIVAGSTTYDNDQAFNISITRPENNISSCVMTLNDYKSKNYIDVFDVKTPFTIWLRYAPDTWTKVFSGKVFEAIPTIPPEILTITAWGYERCLLDTVNDTSYGEESQRNPTLAHPDAVLVDIITNYVNESFNDGVAYYALTTGDIQNVHVGCVIKYLNSNYLDNLSLLNRICDIVNAYARVTGEPGIHWFVDPDYSVHIKEIDNNTDGNWPRYWGGGGAAQTLVVKEDMIRYQFRKTAEDYTNDVILASAFRKPAEDLWTEDHAMCEHEGLDNWWDIDGNVTFTQAGAGAGPGGYDPMVGSYCFKVTFTSDNGMGIALPTTMSWNMNLKAIESQRSPGYLTFYYGQSHAGMQNSMFCLVENGGVDGTPSDAAGDKYFELYSDLGTITGEALDRWSLVRIPVGPHWQTFADTHSYYWIQHNAADWGMINYLYLASTAGVAKNGHSLWLDDLHFSGNIVRRAYDDDGGEWAGNHKQKVIFNPTAVSDSLNWIADTGPAARLACDTLKRGMTTPIVGTVEIPLAINMLPGQQLHIHACQKADGTYRIDSTDAATGLFRIKSLTHEINMGGSRTLVNLTNDVLNSRALGPPEITSLMQEYIAGLTHQEMKDLRGGSLDNLIPRLEKDY